MKPQRIAMSGAQGFVGSHLKAQLRESGHAVIPLTRSAPPGEPEWIRFSLENGVDADRLRGFDSVVHCAYDFGVLDVQESTRRNVEGSERLFRQAHNARVPLLVFISTLSAFPRCRSQYGRGKLAVERLVSEIGGISVRLGFVHDGSDRGLSGRLKKLATNLAVIPLPGMGRQKLYPLSALDLGPSLLRITERAKPGSVIPLAQAEPVTLADLLRTFARQAGKRVHLVPTPWQPIWILLRCLEGAGVRLSFRSDSLLSLVNQDPRPDFSSTHDLGLTLRCFSGPP